MARSRLEGEDGAQAEGEEEEQEEGEGADPWAGGMESFNSTNRECTWHTLKCKVVLWRARGLCLTSVLILCKCNK